MSVFVPTIRPLRRIWSITRLRWERAPTRRRTRASGSPAMAKPRRSAATPQQSRAALGEAGEGSLDGVDLRRTLEAELHECVDRASELRMIELRAVPGDHPKLFEPVDSTLGRRR